MNIAISEIQLGSVLIRHRLLELRFRLLQLRRRRTALGLGLRDRGLRLLILGHSGIRAGLRVVVIVPRCDASLRKFRRTFEQRCCIVAGHPRCL